MNGWQRIGIVASALWVLSMVGYAAYERSLLPVKFFGEETDNPGDGWNVARELLFVDIDSRAAGNIDHAANSIVSAKTDEERRAAIQEMNAASSPRFETSLKGTFWVWLFAPLAGLWALSYLGVYASKWVASGFSSNEH